MQLQFSFPHKDVWENPQAIQKVYTERIIKLMYKDFGLDFAPPSIRVHWSLCERGAEFAHLVRIGTYKESPCLEDSNLFSIIISTSENLQKIPFLAHEIGHYLHYWVQPEQVSKHLEKNGRAPEENEAKVEYTICELIAELSAKYAESRLYRNNNKNLPRCIWRIDEHTTPIEKAAIEMFIKRRSIKSFFGNSKRL